MTDTLQVLRDILAVVHASRPRNEAVRQYVADRILDLEGENAVETQLRNELEAEKTKVADLQRQLVEAKK